MKSLTVWHVHSTRPSLPAEQRGRPAGVATRQAEQACITPPVRNREFPTAVIRKTVFENDTATACQDWLRSTRLAERASSPCPHQGAGYGALHFRNVYTLEGVDTRLCTKSLCQVLRPFGILLTSPVGDVDSWTGKLSEGTGLSAAKRHFCGCNNSL